MVLIYMYNCAQFRAETEKYSVLGDGLHRGLPRDERGAQFTWRRTTMGAPKSRNNAQVLSSIQYICF